jgi:hypothetical protein
MTRSSSRSSLYQTRGDSGAPLAAAGFAWFVPDFAATGADPLGWLGAQALYLHRGPLVQLVLTYPRGRVRGRVEGATVAAGMRPRS